MTDKRDFMTTCNEQRVDLGDFELQFCNRCFQAECTRSIHGTSQFEKRTAQWEDQMFLSVPKMAEDDPRYEQIRAQRFKSYDDSPTPEVGRSAWVDPRELDESTDEPHAVEPPVAEPEPEAPATPVADAAPSKPPNVLMNTPPQTGQMVGGRPTPEKKVRVTKDPWAPEKSTDEDVVQPGAKIRFGDSGV